jgi:hypothetical protein
MRIFLNLFLMNQRKTDKMNNNTINIISGKLVKVLLVVVSLLVLGVYRQA